MAFNQESLDRVAIQSRGIFNKYVYETSDSKADVLVAGYFSQSRFSIIDNDETNGKGWNHGIIECNCSDGVVIAQIDGATGSANLIPASGNGIAQVSITHPAVNYFVTVVGTGTADLNPALGGYVQVLNGFAETLNKNGAFITLADGRVQVLNGGVVQITGFADVSHSENNTNVGAAFSVTRGGFTTLSARAVHSKLPNKLLTGDIGNISGTGTLVAQAGDILGLALASSTSGDVSITSSSLVFNFIGIN